LLLFSAKISFLAEVDFGEKADGGQPPPPFSSCKKKKKTEGRKAGRASETKPLLPEILPLGALFRLLRRNNVT